MKKRKGWIEVRCQVPAIYAQAKDSSGLSWAEYIQKLVDSQEDLSMAVAEHKLREANEMVKRVSEQERVRQLINDKKIEYQSYELHGIGSAHEVASMLYHLEKALLRDMKHSSEDAELIAKKYETIMEGILKGTRTKEYKEAVQKWC